MFGWVWIGLALVEKGWKGLERVGKVLKDLNRFGEVWIGLVGFCSGTDIFG